MGIGLSLGLGLGAQSATLAPLSRLAALYGPSTPGDIWLASDLSRIWQDAGVTPGAVSQSIGRHTGARAAGTPLQFNQTSAGLRPRLARVPKGGRRNLLTYTEQLDNAAWAKSGGALSTDADGIYDRFTPSAATANANIAVVSGPFVVGQNTVSVDFKASGVSWARIRIATGVAGGNTSTGNRPGSTFANFDLGSGAEGLVSGNAANTSSIEDIGNGYYRCTFNFLCTGAGTLVVQFMALQSDIATDFPSFTWNGTDSLLLGRAQAETSSTATAYQRVTTAFDVTEAGVETIWQWAFDQVDDVISAPVSFGSTPMDVFIVAERTGNAALATDAAGSATERFGMTEASATTAPHDGGGTPAYYINGTLVSPTQRGALATAWPVNSQRIVEARGLDLNTWANLTLGFYTSFAGLSRVRAIMAIDSTTAAANRATIMTALAQATGVTL